MLFKRNRNLLKIVFLADARDLLLQTLLQLCVCPRLEPDLQTVADGLLRGLALRLTTADNANLVQNTSAADVVALVHGLANHGEHNRLPELSELVVGTDYTSTSEN